MQDLNEMRREISALIEQARAVVDKAATEKRTLTGEEQTEYDRRWEDIKAKRAALKQEEDLREAEASLRRDPAPHEPDLDDDNPPAEPAKRFASFGEQLQAVARAYQHGVADKRLSGVTEEFRATGMSEGIPADGGFLVQTDFATELKKRVYNTGILASRTERIPSSSGANSLKMNAIAETSRVDGSRHGGVQAYWAAEAALKTASAPKFRQIELNLKKLIGLYYATDELLQDAAALDAVASAAFAEEFGFKLDEAILNGTGAGQPLGIMNSPALVSVTKETGQAADTITYENLISMWSRLYAPSRSKAVWFINQDVEPQFYTMGLTLGVGGTPVFLPPGGASGSPYSTIFGRPIVPIEQAATLGDKGDILLADLSEYILFEKGGIQSASSIHVKFIYDETTFRFVMRVDGQPWWVTALTPYKGSNTLSPFVTLDARA